MWLGHWPLIAVLLLSSWGRGPDHLNGAHFYIWLFKSLKCNPDIIISDVIIVFIPNMSVAQRDRFCSTFFFSYVVPPSSHDGVWVCDKLIERVASSQIVWVWWWSVSRGFGGVSTRRRDARGFSLRGFASMLPHSRELTFRLESFGQSLICRFSYASSPFCVYIFYPFIHFPFI